MHDSGLGYRRIAKRLRDMNIKTASGSLFKNNNVVVSMSINGAKCISRLKESSYEQNHCFEQSKNHKIKVNKMAASEARLLYLLVHSRFRVS